jgi:hypothetical protein
MTGVRFKIPFGVGFRARCYRDLGGLSLNLLSPSLVCILCSDDCHGIALHGAPINLISNKDNLWMR